MRKTVLTLLGVGVALTSCGNSQSSAIPYDDTVAMGDDTLVTEEVEEESPATGDTPQITTISLVNEEPETNVAIGINLFCEPLSKSGGSAQSMGISNKLFRQMQSIKSDAALNSSLIADGFQCITKRQKHDYDESIDDYVDYMVATYMRSTSDGNITVSVDYDGITINFPTAAMKQAFMKSIEESKSKGCIYQSNEAYWVGVRITQSGNTVELIPCGG